MAAVVPNSRQLVLDALAGRPVPRVPIAPLAVHFCARFAGVSLRRYTTDATVLADCVVRYHERFRPDAVWLSADTWISAEAMGARVGAEGDDQPFGGLGPPRVQSPADLDRIPTPDPGSQGRYPLMLEALQRIRAGIGPDVGLVVCFDQYPFSLAAALLGLQETMLRVVDDHPFVEAVMERTLEYGVAYARALAAGGADVLSGGDAPAGLLGPRLYRTLAWPFERRLIEALKSTTSQPVSLHICGRALPLLPDMAATGADLLEVDQNVDLNQACAAVGPGVALWGNLDPVALLAQGSPAEVREAAGRARAAMQSAGHARFVLSSGCTLAVETPAANLDALMRSDSIST